MSSSFFMTKYGTTELFSESYSTAIDTITSRNGFKHQLKDMDQNHLCRPEKDRIAEVEYENYATRKQYF